MASVPVPDQHAWKKRISNNAAGALLVFTLLHIGCFTALAGFVGSSLVSYLGIAILVGLVIPALARFESHWHGEALQGLGEGELGRRFRRDRAQLWIAAIFVPFVWSGLFLGLYLIARRIAG